jgi:F5/8 type C domain
MTTTRIVISGLTVTLAIVGGMYLFEKPVSTKENPASTSRQLPEKQQAATPSLPKPVVITTALTKEVARIAQPSDKELLTIPLPKPIFAGTPSDMRTENLEPDRAGKPRDPLNVPKGTRLLSKDCKVTSSDTAPLIGELSSLTDGDKEHDSTTCVELGINIQWVQVDLGKEKELFAASVWHYHGDARVYKDVICQVSNDPDFIENVQTVFNNDHDNSSKLGRGTDREYFETNEGRPFPINGVKARYVRFYSRGNSSNETNHYTEIEVYGKDI